MVPAGVPTGIDQPPTGEIAMRTIVAGLILSLASFAAVAGETAFQGTCAYGLSEFGVAVKTDCKINWQDPKSGRTYCFSEEQAKQAFLKDPAGNLRKAEAKYAELSRK
jgi:YHS domain-containing protein